MSQIQDVQKRHDRTVDHDAVVVGAGFAGMYLLKRLREAGLSVKVLEAGTDVGGTWYWNRYPGARCDVPSMEYSYSFDPDLEQEWEWTEVMSAQPEILAYAQHVADRFDLRPDIRFETRVVAASFDDDTATWTITTDAGDQLTCTYCVMATGALSVPNTPDLPGIDDFEGTLVHTGYWPKEGVDLDGKRVGVIGTGSSAVQAIPVIAEQAGHLTLFQRTPVYTFPANNKPLRDDVQAAYKAHYSEVRDRQRHSPTGFSGFNPLKPDKAGQEGDAPKRPRSPRPEILDTTPEQRREMWEQQGFNTFNVYRDVFKDLDANELACELYRDHVRSVVIDPDKAEKLLPRDYPLGCKRQVIDTDFYDTFNRDNVDILDLRAEPLTTIDVHGVHTTEQHVELDVLVLATGFDAMTGALDRIDITGRSGRTLRDKWRDGPRAYLGLQMEGFPNLFTVTGPGSPSVLSNVIVAIEHHVEWIDECIAHLRATGHRTIEPTADAESEWGEHVAEVAQGTMYTAPNCASWYLGSNIPGKPRVFLPYVGGMGRYRAHCDEVVDNGYDGFVIA
jgi:cyclohexanone monooxygenase